MSAYTTCRSFVVGMCMVCRVYGVCVYVVQAVVGRAAAEAMSGEVPEGVRLDHCPKHDDAYQDKFEKASPLSLQ